jgi:universal stress protein E
MKKLSRVLCVVDPTSREHLALERAAWLCGKSKAQLDLFICDYNEHLSGQRLFDSPSLENARQKVGDEHLAFLEKLAAPLRKSGLEIRTSSAWDYPLHEGIIRHAVSIKADMLIKDTRYHSALERMILSNSDWQLIRSCPVPLWLAKTSIDTAQPLFICSIDPMNQHDKPAALDDAILQIGKSLATLCGGEVHAFHAYDPRIAMAATTVNAYLPVSLPYDEINTQMRERHDKRFREITDYHDIEPEYTHLVSGRTEDELPQLADKLNAAVVVMGAVARNRLDRLFVGSTAERTLNHLHCDLLIIKPDWFRTPDSILKKKT